MRASATNYRLLFGRSGPPLRGTHSIIIARARARCFSRAQIALLAGPADEWSAGPELAPVEPVYMPISAGGRGKVRRALFGDGSGSGENLVVFESARQATARIQSVKRAAEKSLSSSRV